MAEIYNSYRFRAYPTTEQEESLFRTIGCARKVYNLTLSTYEDLYEVYSNEDIDEDTYKALKKSVNPSIYKEDNPYLKDVDSLALNYAKRNCDKAYNNFFKGNAQFPQYKSRNTSKWSYTTSRASVTSNNLRLERGGNLILPRIGSPLKIVVHRNPKGVLMSATITKDRSGKWYVSLRYKQHVSTPKIVAKPQAPIGLDMGIKDLATGSDGLVIPNHKHGYAMKDKIAKIDKKMSRQREQAKKDGKRLSECSNYQKTKRKRARLYEKVRNRRHDHLHKATSLLSQNYDFIGMETLSSSNMMKNHNLAYAIADSSWNEFSTFLKYKMSKQGNEVVFIDRFIASTQTCSHCGEVTGPKGLTELSVRQWQCSHCHTHHDRDMNAAQNILYKGIEQSTTIGTMGKEGLLYSLKTGLHHLSMAEQESSSGEILPVKVLESEAFSSL